jgi:hypothetical protein
MPRYRWSGNNVRRKDRNARSGRVPIRKNCSWDTRAFVTNGVLEGDHMRRHECRRGTHECARHIVDKLVDVDVRNRRWAINSNVSPLDMVTLLSGVSRGSPSRRYFKVRVSV